MSRTGNEALVKIINLMRTDEMIVLLGNVFGRRGLTSKTDAELRLTILNEVILAGSNSLPWTKRLAYDDILIKAAERMKVKLPRDCSVAEIEKLILFVVVKKSLEKLTAEQKEKLTAVVLSEMEAKGIQRELGFNEIYNYVKFMGFDVGGTAGGFVMAAPGVSGLVGLNFLQWAILKGIVLTSGHIAGASALFGLGAGGALLTAAGFAGPLGVAVAAIFSGYIIAGPAYRKVIPAICIVAAKRIESDLSPDFV